MATTEQLIMALQRADAAGDVEGLDIYSAIQ